MSIKLTDEEKQIGEQYNEENEKYLQILYDLFGEMTAYQLVAISHAKNSPWYELNKRCNSNIPHNEIIDKTKTKIWFESLLVKNENK